MKDLVGREMTATEKKLLKTLRACEELLAEPLAPAVEANVKEAAAALWIAANDLALVTERPAATQPSRYPGARHFENEPQCNTSPRLSNDFAARGRGPKCSSA